MGEGQQINNPKVSVIVPVYNTEAYVEEAVRSIMNQTLRDIEIIVINDGSTDNSLSVVENLALQDARISVYSQVNQGPSITRNQGMQRATGDYLYFMDSDDVLAAGALEKCYQACESENLDFVFFDADSFSENNAISLEIDYHRSHLFEEGRVYTGIEMLDTMLQEQMYRASVWLNLINRDFIKLCRLSFYPEIIHEDELFTAALYLHARKVSCVHSTFYHRRVREGSIMTNSFSLKNIESYLTIIRQLKSLPGVNARWSEVVDKLIAYIINPAVYNSKGLPLKIRIKIVRHCTHHKYLKYIRLKNLTVLLFPFLVTIKSGFKKRGHP